MPWQNKPVREPAQIGIRIQVDATAYQKLLCWVDVARHEVSALGLVSEVRDTDTGLITGLIVTDFFLVKQTCSMDETTMDEASVAELIMSLEAQGIDSRMLRCWAHSHGGLGVFWSGTDDQCIEGLANGDYLLSLVVNKKRDSMMRLDVYHPCHLYLSDVVWEVYSPLPEALQKACIEEFQAKVIESNGRISVLHDLKSARERGALTDHELLEEIDWLGLERDEFEEQPF